MTSVTHCIDPGLTRGICGDPCESDPPVFAAGGRENVESVKDQKSRFPDERKRTSHGPMLWKGEERCLMNRSWPAPGSAPDPASRHHCRRHTATLAAAILSILARSTASRLRYAGQ
ncbi:hypothetical protein J6590_016349 [Homalodisca vitripennis]|nr:hypothetical protein J6590_016349 [Homalodisca vitripennis]